MKRTTCLLIDDHAVMRKGLVSLLGTCPEIRVVADVGNGEDGIREALARRPDVVIMDLLMPGMNGVETTRRLKAEWPGANVLILTTMGSSNALRKARDAGARGAVLKSADLEELRAALVAVGGGGEFFSGEIAKIMSEDTPVPELTPRQREILLSLMQGLSNSDIALQLGISLPMVKEHLTALFKRLGVANRTEAVSFALRTRAQEF